MLPDLTGLPVFLTVAQTRSFRAAAQRLGVTHSAVSQTLRRLEDRLGVALVQRTTRSVTLTEVGQALYERVAPALNEVGDALQRTGDDVEHPRGVLRLAVSSIAERMLSGVLFANFMDQHPGIKLDVTITDDDFDIVAGGYDAGVRLGEVLEQDMIAVPVSADQRQIVVGAPAYVARFGVPAHPRDLPHHRCIGWRPAPDQTPYRWEFTENGRDFDVAVEPQVTTNDMGLMLRTALAGGGLTFGMRETFQPHLDTGALVPLLEDFCAPFPGFFLYFASRRHLAPKLRAFIEHMRFRPPERLRADEEPNT